MGRNATFLSFQLTFQVLVQVLVLAFGNVSFADEFIHPGYTDSVEDERYEITREVVILPPVTEERIAIRDQIFTEKITKDLRREYLDRFGYSEAEQLENSSNRYVELETAGGRLTPVDEHIKQQEKFGNYMLKELTEVHVDAYLRGNRSTRKVYEVKQKISNIDVATKSGYKFKFRYKLSSNKMSFNYEKPGSRFHNRLLVHAGGKDTELRMGYDVSKKVLVESAYEFVNDVTSVQGTRRLSPSLQTTITGQKFAKGRDGEPPQDRLLLGLTWRD